MAAEMVVMRVLRKVVKVVDWTVVMMVALKVEMMGAWMVALMDMKSVGERVA